MADFSHLRALEVSADSTVEYTIHQITVNGKTPTLIVAPATDVNKPYFNALIKSASKTARAVKAGAINAAMLDESRDEDQALYPRFVVKGWLNMIDATGEDVKFSQKDCASFLENLPNWVFDEVRIFCGNPGSFTEMLDLEVKAKN